MTRRFGWWFLKPGDKLWAVEKAQGLKKGEKVRRICQIEIVSTEKVALNTITQSDCVKEGFPELKLLEFVVMLSKHYCCHPGAPINRIEFKYL